MHKLFLDTETCGYHGPIVLFQYRVGDDEVTLYEPWQNPLKRTLELYEWVCGQEVIGFNLNFDWFHICQQYCTFKRLAELTGDHDLVPVNLIESEEGKDLLVKAEDEGRDGPCLKPANALDLMLFARKGKYQSMMNRKNIAITKVPYQIATFLRDWLEENIQFDDIYFARKGNPKERRWKLRESRDRNKQTIEGFYDVVVSFAPSTALKALIKEIFQDDAVAFSEVAVDKYYQPVEIGYAPYAKAVMRLLEPPGNKNLRKFKGKFRGSWPDYIDYHISHWRYNKEARKYAELDVVYTQKLYHHFGAPEAGDDDSILACAVGANRWKGLTVDLDQVNEVISNEKEKIKKVPKDPGRVKEYLFPHLTPDEIEFTKGSTGRPVLETIAKWDDHPAQQLAKDVLDSRRAYHLIGELKKILHSERFHHNYDVIGTKSSRMSGGGTGQNSQGWANLKYVRRCFTLAHPGMTLGGGDFESFEVSIYEAVVNDPQLRKNLQNGMKFHGIFGTYLFPGNTYEDILASKGSSDDKYTKSKSGVFAYFYGGNENTLEERLGIPQHVGREALFQIQADYPRIFEFRKELEENFSPLRQPGGIGTKFYWVEPAEYVDSLMGFKRYFNLEWMMCRKLYDLAQNPPKEIKAHKEKVVRTRDRIQTAGGATQSALFAAACSIQNAVFRAAANHKIQSPGGQITKHIERRIWDLQPVGVNNWEVMLMNSHDEIMAPSIYPERVENLAQEVVEELREYVPFLKLDWGTGENWEALK